MSLTVNVNTAADFPKLPEGTYLAVCNLLVDLGMQVNEKFNSKSRKVQIGWETPEETFEFGDKRVPYTVSKEYTASLNEAATLRQDLAAWRGRDFTPEELAGFDLKNIVGTSCLINVIHKENKNGKVYVTVSSIMALPKGMQKGKLSDKPVVFDLDVNTLDDVDLLPNWLGDKVRKSKTYQEKVKTADSVFEPTPGDSVKPLADEDDLPW